MMIYTSYIPRVCPSNKVLIILHFLFKKIPIKNTDNVSYITIPPGVNKRRGGEGRRNDLHRLHDTDYAQVKFVVLFRSTTYHNTDSYSSLRKTFTVCSAVIITRSVMQESNWNARLQAIYNKTKRS